MLFELLRTKQRFSATSKGSRIVTSECEQCHARYSYRLGRAAVVSVDKPILVRGDGAEMAQDLSESRLHSKLNTESEMVACPQCNWVNKRTIDWYRQTHFRWLRPAGKLCLWLGLATTLTVALWYASYEHNAIARRILMIGLPLSVLIRIIAIRLQKLLRDRIDPNSTFPREPSLPLGTPAARLIDANSTKSPRTGKLSPRPARTDGGWAIMQSGRDDLLNICCNCLDESSQPYKPRLMLLAHREMAVPMCKSCIQSRRNRMMICSLAIIIVIALIAIAALLQIKNPSEAQMFLICMLAFVGATLAVTTIPLEICRPYSLRIVDQVRSVWRIRFRNREYTQRLAVSIEP